MGKKRDTARRRLAEFFATSPLGLDELDRLVAQLPTGWRETRGFDVAAGLSLRLDPKSDVDQPLMKAFASAGLDYQNPFHWRFLIAFFAWAHFSNPGPGRPKKWELEQLEELLRDVKSLGPKKTASNLRKRYPQKYGRLKDDRLRKLVKEARDIELTRFPENYVERAIQPADRTKWSNAIAKLIRDEIMLKEKLRRYAPRTLTGSVE